MDQRLQDPAGAAPPDWRGLCSRMADELDHYRQLLTDDHREVHPLAAEARAVLARFGHQPEPPAEGEVAELAEFLRVYGDEVMDEYGDAGEHDMLTRAADLLEQRQAAPVPVAVSERPWEREGWCDDEDRCWCMSSLDGPPPRWWLVRPEPLSDGWVLPANALPLPLPAGEVE